MELLVARNPNLESSLPYLLWVPLEGGLVFREGPPGGLPYDKLQAVRGGALTP
jgi:hypothetical protein